MTTCETVLKSLYKAKTFQVIASIVLVGGNKVNKGPNEAAYVIVKSIRREHLALFLLAGRRDRGCSLGREFCMTWGVERLRGNIIMVFLGDAICRVQSARGFATLAWVRGWKKVMINKCNVITNTFSEHIIIKALRAEVITMIRKGF